MCQQHRLGEHVEAHMFVGSMCKGISFDGYYENHLFFGPKVLWTRHELLARTFESHQSSLVVPSEWPNSLYYPNIELTPELIEESTFELIRRCFKCNQLYTRRMHND